MTHAITLAHLQTGEAPRLSPLEAFVQWLANFIRLITGMKHRKVFPKNWKDHWPGLRELEWYRDQILAFSAQHVLSGGSLSDRTDFQLVMDVPDRYGVCPRTPKAMNRRFIAMAQFRLDPNTYIHRHIRRVARLASIALTTDASGRPLRLASRATSPNAPHWRRKETVLSANADALPRPRKARGRWCARSCAHARGSSRDSCGHAQARAPPTRASMSEKECQPAQRYRASEVAAVCAFAGRSSVARKPLPSWFFSSSTPPWARMIASVRVRPRPAPPVSRLREVSPR